MSFCAISTSTILTYTESDVVQPIQLFGGKFDGKNTYIFESSDPDLLDAIKDYCIWLKVKLISDAGAQEVEKELEKRTEDFEKLKKYAIKVKNQKQSTIKIPYLKKGIKLKSYQNLDSK